LKRAGPFPAPAPLFPLEVEPQTALDMIPVVSDPTGRGARAWSILSRLPLTEGEFAGRRIGEHAPPWEDRLTRLLFGHTDDRGLRMIREAFISMSKKNGKTAYGAAVALTKLLLDEEQREQVLFLAANRLQGRLAFEAMSAMIRADGVLGERFEVVDGRHLIRYLPTDSVARAISSEMASIVGTGPSLAVVDELHLLGGTPRGAQLVSQIRTGSVSRREPMLLSISTAPVDRAEGVFAATYDKARRVIAGEEVDARFFGWICEVPANLDPEAPANWHWSNPSLGFTVTRERLESDLARARSDPQSLRAFRSQNLNISPEDTAGEGRWLALEAWDAAADTTLTIDRLLAESKLIVAGIDAGGLDDLSALVLLGRTGADRFLVWSHQWLSRQGYAKRAATNPYDEFIAAKELTIFDGGDADIEEIATIMQRVSATGDLSLIGIDAFGATGLSDALAPTSVEVVSVPQGWRLTPSLSWVERQIAEAALTHSGSGLMRWNMGNAVVTRVGNARSVTKATAVGAGKIDGVAALLNAAAAYLAAPPPAEYQMFFLGGAA
jgi:phage terminase large subunit-like protein